MPSITSRKCGNIPSWKKLFKQYWILLTVIQICGREKNPQSYHSAITLITLDLRRDRADILSYLSEMKNSLADIRPDVVKCWDCSKNGKLTPIYSLLVQIKLFGGDAQIVAMSGKRLSLTALKVTVVQSALKGKSVDAI